MEEEFIYLIYNLNAESVRKVFDALVEYFETKNLKEVNSNYTYIYINNVTVFPLRHVFNTLESKDTNYKVEESIMFDSERDDLDSELIIKIKKSQEKEVRQIIKMNFVSSRTHPTPDLERLEERLPRLKDRIEAENYDKDNYSIDSIANLKKSEYKAYESYYENLIHRIKSIDIIDFTKYDPGELGWQRIKRSNDRRSESQ